MSVEFVVTDISLFNSGILDARALFYQLNNAQQQIALLPLRGKTNTSPVGTLNATGAPADYSTEAKYQIVAAQPGTNEPLHLALGVTQTQIMRLSLQAIGTISTIELNTLSGNLIGSAGLINFQAVPSTGPVANQGYTMSFEIGLVSFQVQFDTVT
ncbi:MAG: hypothetical protein ABI700_26655 [Chloroflexota bacterium]